MAQISEKKRIIIDRSGCLNPFYVVWINPLGGIDQWLFSIRQINGQEINTEDTFSPNYDGIETAKATLRQLRKSVTPSITAFAGELTEDEVRGLMTLRQSIAAWWYRSDGKYEEIIPDAGSFEEYDNYGSLHEFEIKFNLQPKFIQAN